MVKKICVFILVGCLFAPVHSRSGPSEVISFGLIKDVPPYSYEKSGQIIGIDYEIFLELQRRIGFKSNLKLLPFKRLWEYAQKGNLDVILQLYHKPQREAYVIYTSVPARWSEHYVFVRKDNRHLFEGDGLKALYGKKVGKDRGYFISTEFDKAVSEKRFQVDEAGTTVANIKKLHRGRMDCFISAYHVAMATARQLGVQAQITHLPEPIIPEKGVFIALSKSGKNISDKTAFLKRLNTELGRMHEDGTMKKIEDIFLK